MTIAITVTAKIISMFVGYLQPSLLTATGPQPHPHPQPQPQQQKYTSCSIQNGEYKGSYLDLEFSLATSLKKIAKVNYQSMIYEHIADSLLFERTQQYAVRLQGFLQPV